MGLTGIVILILSILAANAVLWLVVLLWLRARLRRSDAELRSLIQGGEHFVIEPSVGTYRGATDRFGRVKGTGMVALTDRRLLCRKVLGALIDVPLPDVVSVREDKWFLRSYNGRPHMILKLSDGVEVGFQIRDQARWLSLLQARLAPPPA